MRLVAICLLASAILIPTQHSTRAADIVDTAVNAGSFNTLVAAVKAAGLVDTLKSPGPLTVFAPTDEAFAKLPEGTVETLLKPENRDALVDILTFHVVPGSVAADQVVGLTSAGTVNGQRVDIGEANGTVTVDDANVVQTDIRCDNGIIHVIDSVILPVDQTIPEVASAAGQFSTLLAAVGAAGLAETLGGDGPFTVFAPNDDAFDALPAGTVDSLLKPENKSKLVDVLTYHVVSGRVYSDQALGAKSAATLQGSSVKIQPARVGALINDARLLAADIDASNGVIHVIDRVLLPGNSTSAVKPAVSVDAAAMIRGAINRGVPIFNAGDHGRCAKIYRETIEALLPQMQSAEIRGMMTSTLNSAAVQHSAAEQAWTLRRGMDRVLMRLP